MLNITCNIFSDFDLEDIVIIEFENKSFDVVCVGSQLNIAEGKTYNE